MGQTQIGVEVKIEPGTPTPAQQAAWSAIWRKLLSNGQKQTTTDNEGEKGQR